MLFAHVCLLPVPASLLQLLPVPLVLGVHDDGDSFEFKE
jgi:hypothetical protein